MLYPTELRGRLDQWFTCAAPRWKGARGFGPCGAARNGLPMEVQIVGPLGADQTVLRAARAIEQVLPMARVPGHT